MAYLRNAARCQRSVVDAVKQFLHTPAKDGLDFLLGSFPRVLRRFVMQLCQHAAKLLHTQPKQAFQASILSHPKL